MLQLVVCETRTLTKFYFYLFFNNFYSSYKHDIHIWSIILYVYTSLRYKFIEQLGLILTIFDWMHVFLIFFTAIYFSMCFMSAILLAKPSMPGTMFWNLQQYMCIFVIVKNRSNIGGMSDGVPKMISVLLKFIFVYICFRRITWLSASPHQLEAPECALPTYQHTTPRATLRCLGHGLHHHHSQTALWSGWLHRKVNFIIKLESFTVYV